MITNLWNRSFKYKTHVRTVKRKSSRWGMFHLSLISSSYLSVWWLMFTEHQSLDLQSYSWQYLWDLCKLGFIQKLAMMSTHKIRCIIEKSQSTFWALLSWPGKISSLPCRLLKYYKYLSQGRSSCERFQIECTVQPHTTWQALLCHSLLSASIHSSAHLSLSLSSV